MKSYNFRQCSLELLEKLFDIEETDSSKALDDWMIRKDNTPLTNFEQMSIEHIQKNMKRNIRAWNEQE